MEDEELKLVLRPCKIYIGEKDNFSKNNFELLMFQCGCDWTTFRVNARVERFIRIGNGGELVLPKNMYDMEGNLCHYPIEDQHVRALRTKSQRGSLPKLVEAGTQQARPADVASKEPKKKMEVEHAASPNTLLYDRKEEAAFNEDRCPQYSTDSGSCKGRPPQ
jgi:hypothetical protein